METPNTDVKGSRLEEKFEQIKDSPKTAHFEQSDGFSEEQRDKFQSIRSDIKKAQEKMGFFSTNSEPKKQQTPEVQAPEEDSPETEVEPEDSSEGLSDEELDAIRAELESDEEQSMDDDGYSDEELEELTRGL